MLRLSIAFFYDTVHRDYRDGNIFIYTYFNRKSLSFSEGYRVERKNESIVYKGFECNKVCGFLFLFWHLFRVN